MKLKKLVAFTCAVMILLSCVYPSFAASKVTYDGNAQKFIFEPGSKYSPTDLFTNFKSVMPGDSITQTITVSSNVKDKVKVNIYMRSLGADEESRDFLSKLKLRVLKSTENTMDYMFNVSADQSAGLDQWFMLGTLYSGGKVNLNVILDVPTELDNEYMDKIGYLEWEFMVEEFPAEPDDPRPPQTGDSFNVYFWVPATVISAGLLFFIVFKRRKQHNEEEAD